jgi:hypothetical protein
VLHAHHTVPAPLCTSPTTATAAYSIGDDVVALLMTSGSPLVRELFEASHNGSAKASESSGPGHKVRNWNLTCSKFFGFFFTFFPSRQDTCSLLT